jgi:hypothetical protein
MAGSGGSSDEGSGGVVGTETGTGGAGLGGGGGGNDPVEQGMGSGGSGGNPGTGGSNVGTGSGGSGQGTGTGGSNQGIGSGGSSQGTGTGGSSEGTGTGGSNEGAGTGGSAGGSGGNAPDAGAGTGGCDGSAHPQTGGGENLACTRTEDYWENHAGAWPVGSLVIGQMSYSKDELIDLLMTESDCDASVILGHQLIGALLNQAAGAAVPAPIANALSAAQLWMETDKDPDGRLPYGVSTATPDGSAAVALSSVLEEYNNGHAGAPRCR